MGREKTMGTAAEKAAQRKAGIAARRALSEADRAAANAALCRRIAQLRCFREAQTLLAYAAFGGEADLSALLAEAEKRHVPVTTVVQNYNPRRTSVVLGEEEKVLYGKGFILDTLCGKTYALSPRSSTSCSCPAPHSTPRAAASGWGKATMTATCPAARTL